MIIEFWKDNESINKRLSHDKLYFSHITKLEVKCVDLKVEGKPFALQNLHDR